MFFKLTNKHAFNIYSVRPDDNIQQALLYSIRMQALDLPIFLKNISYWPPYTTLL